jgi:AcrR family transcriptional regulator
MQAATAPERSLAGGLPSEKAARIVEAMRASVAERGIAGSTFDHVAREAGVSRGLLHYYFGTKERLLVEVVRRESDVRGESLDQAVAGAAGADELIDALVRSLEEILGEGTRAMVTFYELLTLGQRNPEIAAELAELSRRTRTRLAGALRIGSEAGKFKLRGSPDDVASFLFALADGVTIRRMAEPHLDTRPLMDLAVSAARALLA